MKSNAPIVILSLVILVLLGLYLYKENQPKSVTQIPTNNSSAKSENISITSPAGGNTVGDSFKITGQGRVFENTMQVRVTNNRTGSRYLDNTVMTDAKDVGLFGNYSVDVNLSAEQDLNSGDTLTVEAFQYSAKDGSETDKASIILIYKK